MPGDCQLPVKAFRAKSGFIQMPTTEHFQDGKSANFWVKYFVLSFLFRQEHSFREKYDYEAYVLSKALLKFTLLIIINQVSWGSA